MNSPFALHKLFSAYRGGAIALSTILIVGIIVVEIAAASLLVSYFASQEGFGARLLLGAETAARFGTNEAIRRMMQGDYSATGGTFSLSVNEKVVADVIVCKDLKTVTSACDTSNEGRYEITTLGTALTKKSKMRSYVVIDETLGKVIIESTQYGSVQ